MLQDHIVQGIGFLVLIGLTFALLFAFREQLLPSQEDGDVFGTVYVVSEPQEDDLPGFNADADLDE